MIRLGDILIFIVPCWYITLANNMSYYELFRDVFRFYISLWDSEQNLWYPEDWYPELCPPEIPKKELLRDVDFTKVDEEARKTEDSLKESFDLLIKHLTSNADTDLHKLRSIFVWMGHQEVGCRQEKSECKKGSPRYYLQKACEETIFISRLFAKMCRVANIPCILVTGQAKDSRYDPGDEDIGQYTWAVVYVAGSWRFVFPHWAFVKLNGYQKGNWMLVEDSGQAFRKRFTSSPGSQVSAFDEFFWLTDPEMMQYICYTPNKEYQLLPEPQTKEKFLALPCFSHNYFSSGWSLIDPLTCVIKPEDGWCYIDLCSPIGSSELQYKLFFKENRSRTSFPQEVQTDRYVTILKRAKQSKSIMVRLPVIGTYKLEVNGGLVKFRIVCKHVPSDIRPLPPSSENGHGFTEQAAAAGLSQPFHTERVVPVKSGEEIDFSFTVQEDNDIKATLVHHTGKRKNLEVQRENESASIGVRLPEDDAEPEYGKQIDIIKNRQADESSKQKFPKILSYQVPNDETLNGAIVDKDKQTFPQNCVYKRTTCAVGSGTAENFRSAFVYPFLRGPWDSDYNLWKPEDRYPALCPPEIPKKELLRDIDFTKVDEEARKTEDSLKESFDLLIKHLTSNADTDLHKLRSIFVWMGQQEVGCRREKSECKNEQSPRYYLQKAYEEKTFINKLFVKMCRVAKIPCILVNGQAKDSTYDPGDEDIRGECTWAVVYVAGSWRFVFPQRAFVSAIYYQKGNWRLVEESGGTYRQRFTARPGSQVSAFDEFFWLTDPEMMQYICYTPNKEYQLLPEPQTKEKFLALPCFNHYYFSSGWSLIDPWTYVIKPEDGWCFINFCSPTASSKLQYELFYDENCSMTSFPQELQTDRYVTILKRTTQSKSIMVRLPVIGTYKLEVNGGLVNFRIVCEHVPSDIRPLPPSSENGHGFTEEAAAAGLSQPSHTEGVVPVKSGEEIDFSFTVQEDIDIMATLVHHTGKRKNLEVQRENERASVGVRLPEDDPKPEYALQIDIIKNRLADESSKQKFTNILSYLLTSNDTLNAAIVDKDKQELLQCYEQLYDWVSKDDERLVEEAAFRVKVADIKDPILNGKIREQRAKFSRMRKEVLEAARDRNVDRLNLALTHCIASNLNDRGDVEDAKKVLLELCKEDVKQALKNLQANKLRKSLDKAANTCISEWVREQAWFQKGQEAHRRLEELQRRRQDLQSLSDEERANMIKPPDYKIDVLYATYILLGESQTELDTWQNIWKKLKQTGEDQLFARAISFDDTNLRKSRVDLAEEKLKKWELGDEDVIKRLHLWCLERIEVFRLRQEITID